MDEKSFLPDGKPVLAHALANVQYRRDDFKKIAEGLDPSTVLMPSNIEPLWGLLYTCDDGIGFFVHPTEAPLAMLFRANQAEPPKPMHLEIPYESIAHAEIIHPKEPKTKIGKFCRKFSSRPEAELFISWKRNETEHTIRFFISNYAGNFTKSFGEKRQ